MPLCRPLGDGLWEVRTPLPSSRIARVLFSVQQGRILVLHGFIKKSQKTPADDLATLDDFLGEEGKRDEFEAIAVKEVLAWEVEQAMKEKNISRNNLAQRMKTSPSQIGRLLDPKDGNVTLTTLQRAASMVGRSLRLELV